MSSIHPAQLSDHDTLLADEEVLAVEQRRQAERKIITPVSAPVDEGMEEIRTDPYEKFSRDY